jgi:hypothetical protein
MVISVTIPNGPVEKRSVGDLYDRKSLPKSLADLINTAISCPKTGEAVYAEKPPLDLFSSNYERLS